MSKKKSSLACSIAPEDVRRGHYVAVLHVVDEYLPFLFDKPGTEPVAIRWLPTSQTQPLEVVDVCLPFVTVVRANGAVCTLDVRRHELARLDDGYARRVVKHLRAHFARRRASRRRRCR
jgi:hypothetical protein